MSVQDARFCHPTFRLNRRGNGSPTICRLRPVEGSNVVGQDQDISGWEAPGTVNAPTGRSGSPRPRARRSPADQAFLDALTRSVIAAIDAAAPPTGLVAAQFRDTLKAPDPVAVVRDRVKVYKDRIAGLLADSATVAARTAEQQRLYGLLLDRRRAFVNHPLFGNLVESGALMPLP